MNTNIFKTAIVALVLLATFNSCKKDVEEYILSLTAIFIFSHLYKTGRQLIIANS